VGVSTSTTAAESGFRRNILLRGALAIPLLYVVLDRLPIHWEHAFASGQALDYYVVNGLLYGIPIAVWGLALVLLIVGSTNWIAWAVVCVGGCAVAVYGLLAVLESEPHLNSALAFGLYAAVLGLWQLLADRSKAGHTAPGPAA
jgi:hypothetical protein